MRTVVLALTPSPSPKGRGEAEKTSKSLSQGEGFRVRVNSGFQARRGLHQVIPKAPNPLGLSRRWRRLWEADCSLSYIRYTLRQAQGERRKVLPIRPYRLQEGHTISSGLQEQLPQVSHCR